METPVFPVTDDGTFAPVALPASPRPIEAGARPAQPSPAPAPGASPPADLPGPMNPPLAADQTRPAAAGGFLTRLALAIEMAVGSSRRLYELRTTAPAWAVSLLVHGAIVFLLGLVTIAPQVPRALAKLDAAMVDTTVAEQQAEELVHIYADPSEAQRTDAFAAVVAAPGLGEGLTTAGAPSDTPEVAMRTPVDERGTLPATEVVSAVSGMTVKPPPALLPREIGGGLGGMIAGDPSRATTDVGEALDQLAREILRHLQKHKLIVVWLFDESNSMKDDQQAIKAKFDRVSAELKIHRDSVSGQQSDALAHAIIGFGDSVHFMQEKPTADINLIGQAIDRLRVDETGNENVCQAIGAAIDRYGRYVNDERRMLLVLATDESGDDGGYVEEARQLAIRKAVPIYVIGRQSMFGKWSVRLPYKDPVTGDTYWPTIRRGPESPGLECLQYDGLHGRWDEQPSGFGPYELARLAKDTGGIYFLLPSEESMRWVKRERAYSMATLREYVPDYESRAVYNERIARSVLRRSLVEIINQTAKYGFRYHYPIDPPQLVERINAEFPKVTEQLNVLIALEQRLRLLEKERDREPDRRWQAHYDLMLAQIVAYQIMAYEYRALLAEMLQKTQAGVLQPQKKPIPGKLVVEWEINHAPDYRAPKQETEKKRAEATALLKTVIERHPNSPWSDLAQDVLDKGFGCRLSEWSHDPKYAERAKLVPKY